MANSNFSWLLGMRLLTCSLAVVSCLHCQPQDVIKTRVLRVKGGMCSSNELMASTRKVCDIVSISEVVLVRNGEDDEFGKIIFEILESKVFDQ